MASSTRTLLIDNFDSFTYNLSDLLWRVNGTRPVVVKNNVELKNLDLLEFDNIVISPGPGHPSNAKDFGICQALIESSDLPVLGVCLGHQGIAHVFGGVVGRAPEPWHGRRSEVFHHSDGLFEGLPSPFLAVRYHSLVVHTLPRSLVPTAHTADHLIMGLAHRTRPIWGVQFHPESVCSEYGTDLVANFRNMTRRQGRMRKAVAVVAGAAQVRGHPQPPREHQVRFISRKLNNWVEPCAAYSHLYSDSANSFWLDSSRSEGGNVRFSIMGDDSGPLAERVTHNAHTQTTTVHSNSAAVEHIVGPFLDFLSNSLASRKTAVPEGLPFEFNLGYVGYLGYELKAETGGLLTHKAPMPDAAMMFVDRAIVFDHQECCCYALCLVDATATEHPCEWIDAIAAEVSRLELTVPTANKRADGTDSSPLRLRHSRKEYIDLIGECLSEIRAGESYEICLTNMASADYCIDPLPTYMKMRSISPVPFGAYLRIAGAAILSASPERFLSVNADGTAESKPIKGTRPRGNAPEEDELIREGLRESEKDRAENLMIVDLVRNDLNRVCVAGSVHVPILFDVETYSSVHQLVSTVRGKLLPNSSAVDCVKAMFPGGSMTGAPKVRTMEIIDRLEREARGVYAGSIGWFGLSGAADLSIVIRTIVAHGGRVSFGIGGAVVSLSDAIGEFDETLVKAKTMLATLGGMIS